MRAARNTPPPPGYGGAPFPDYGTGRREAGVAPEAGTANGKSGGGGASALWCSLNFLLCILGFPLVMALLAPLGVDLEAGENVYFTYPYRVFQMLVAGLALFSVRSNPLPKFSWKFLLLMLFWAMYLYRTYWSMFVDVPLVANLWYHRLNVVVNIFPLFAVVKGWDKIDFRRILKWALVLGAIGLVFSVRNLSIQAAESWKDDIGRAAATRMLHTQALGGFGASLITLSLYMFFVDGWKKIFWQALSVGVALLAAYVMLKAGSRGPLLAVGFAGTLWFGIRRKNLLAVLLLWAFAVGAFLLFKEQILAIIGEISPTMANRASATLESGDTSGRTDLWIECWEMCKQYPLFGYSHTAFGYPHNMFLDGLMMFGMIGGWIITILIFVSLFTALKYLHTAHGCYWWALFVLSGLSQSFTQSGFNGTTLQAPLLILFIWEEYRRHRTPAFPRALRIRPAQTVPAQNATQPSAQIFSLDETVPASENKPTPTASE